MCVRSGEDGTPRRVHVIGDELACGHGILCTRVAVDASFRCVMGSGLHVAWPSRRCDGRLCAVALDDVLERLYDRMSSGYVIVLLNACRAIEGVWNEQHVLADPKK